MLRTAHALVGGFDSVLSDTLSLAQTLGILLTALVAANFIIFTPSVTASVVLEDRVDRSAVMMAYDQRAEPVPDAVRVTLADLDTLSVPRSRTTAAVENSGGNPLTSRSQVAATGAEAAAPSAGSPAPLTDLCARAPEMVNDLFPGACAPGSRIEVPFYDRVLLSDNLKTDPRLASPGMREAAGLLARAVFVRATVTAVNTGRATAQNVTVVPPEGYSPKGDQRTANLGFGQSSKRVFETHPGALTTDVGAVLDNPTFSTRWDPGPIDVSVVTLVFWVFVGLLAAATAVKVADRVLGSLVQRRDEASAAEGF